MMNRSHALNIRLSPANIVLLPVNDDEGGDLSYEGIQKNTGARGNNLSNDGLTRIMLFAATSIPSNCETIMLARCRSLRRPAN